MPPATGRGADVVAVASLFSFLLLASGGASPAPPVAPSPPPRLVVLVVVDQLASWVLEEAWEHLGPDGFRRLEREGVSFPQCAFRHAYTFTGPGHATLGTGALPSDHGIVSNQWYDLLARQAVYCCADPDVTLLGTEAGGPGRSPRLLLAPTLGDTMKAHLGAEAKVAAISWKDRSAILLGGKGADAVAWMDARSGVFVSSTWYGEALPGWLQQLNEARLLDSWFGKTWDRTGPESAYAGLVDDRPLEFPAPDGRRFLPHVINGGGELPSPGFYAQAAASPLGNEIVLEAARAALEGMELGADGTPDLLYLSFSANDLVGHACGPRSVETRDMVLRTDRLLASLLESLEKQVGLDRCLVAVSADHGVGPAPASLEAFRLGAGRAQVARLAARAANQALIEAWGPPPEGTRRWVVEEDATSLYLERDLLSQRGIDLEEARERAASAAGTVPGVALAVSTGRLLRGLLPDGRLPRGLQASVRAERVGDVLLALSPYWVGSTITASHGTPYPYDQEVPLLLRGPGLRRGHRCFLPVTPGVWTVIAARLLRISPPPLAFDQAPGEIFTP